MGGAMDLVAGSRIVVVATAHFDKSGASKLKRRCTLPLTAFGRVSIVVTDLGYFEVKGGKFHLIEWFEPYTPAWIREKTDADVVVTDASRCVSLD
jgi:acetate CoA/acetoacetate CoA-transferase beta subunit